jgi:hypothetical protein
LAAVLFFLTGNIAAQNAATDSTATTAVAAPATAVLEQCANGGVGLPDQQCTGANWVPTDATQANSHWVEGDSVAYRDVFANLVPGTSYTVTIAYNTTNGGKHAFDYLTSYNRTETDAVACSGIPSCVGSPSTFAIPTDGNVTKGPDGIPGTADDITQIPGNFSIWNGTITSVSSYLLNGSYSGDSWTLVSVTFTANSSDAVLAWGGHIATRTDWGASNTAISMTGFPYHMQVYGFIGANVTDFCAQTISVSSGTARPSSLTIIKRANIVGGITSQAFSFIATGGFGSPNTFTLFDNGTVGADTITRTFVTVPGPITVSEIPVVNWTLTDISCSISADSGFAIGTATVTPGSGGSSPTATINLLAANDATCTFTNTFVGPTAAQATLSGRVTTKSGMGIRGAMVTILDATKGTSKVAVTNTLGYYTFTELPVEDLYVLSVSAKRYTFSENSQQSFVMHEDAAGINFTSDQ